MHVEEQKRRALRAQLKFKGSHGHQAIRPPFSPTRANEQASATWRTYVYLVFHDEGHVMELPGWPAPTAIEK